MLAMSVLIDIFLVLILTLFLAESIYKQRRRQVCCGYLTEFFRYSSDVYSVLVT